jgi:cell wall-associated NlpC family hydrolase
MWGTVVRRAGVVAVLVATACSGNPATSATAGRTGGATPSSVSSSSAAPTLEVGRAAWVSVSVATLWRTSGSPRPVDSPALRHPAEIRRWLADMSLAQRRDLNGRADTQALLGDRVVVLRLPANRPAWARVAVPSQPSPLNPTGYPGWVPRRQLAAVAPSTTEQVATVLRRTTWLLSDSADPSRLFPVSVGTSLPVVGAGTTYVRVSTPGGFVRRLPRTAVVVHARGTPALTPTRSSVVTTAERFVGLAYLWAGASGFGVDCSGLTWLTYRLHGIRIPRDAAPQSRHGTRAAPPRRGDLRFYATDGLVHHVSMYVGNGQMVHSPATGQRVVVVPVSTVAGYVGSRRYLP